MGGREGVDEGRELKDVEGRLEKDVGVIVGLVKERGGEELKELGFVIEIDRVIEGGSEEEKELRFGIEEDRVIEGGSEDDTLDLNGVMVGIELEN